MSSQPKPRYRFEDYLVFERECVEEKHEFVAGQFFAMTGASYNHNVITANLLRRLGNQLESGPCTALANDMRLRIETADACTYPDVVVLCNEPSFHDSRKDVITDATLVAEVLSPSTEGYDRGGKFALYRRLGGLCQYLLVAQDRPAVDLFTRQADGRWVLDAYGDPDQPIQLESIGCVLRLRDIYEKVSFEPQDAADPGGGK
jgi:Uma2 family endonuclease